MGNRYQNHGIDWQQLELNTLPLRDKNVENNTASTRQH